MLVSGPTGSTLSQTALIILTSVVMRPSVTVMGAAGRAYRIDFKNTAEQAAWTVLTNFTLPFSPYHHVDFSAEGHPQRFYRVVAP